ncbi:MAG TPA: hypothetical protein VGQ21_11350 [Thermoanaerobaculia bacterium]|nr:hypothetical protein [Thermoanaerobaculia bacterium]
MLDALLSIIDRLVKLTEGRIKSRKETFATVLDPTFNDLLLIHGNYIDMFERRQIFGGIFPDTELEIQRRLQIAKAELREKRREFEPVRQKVRALVSVLAKRELPPEERRFVDAVLRYFPSGDPALPQSAATTILKYLDRAAPEDVDLLIDATIQRQRDAWSDVCTEYAALKIKIVELH